ncbi:EF-hand domain-containing protein [Bryocella elongata]|uniref:EF-hand domain-containing protein n=1 Tax=Bryocella elongata TaxID=863522 RepID=UPI00135A392C|nr:EF-hand domain-containing protein [Bryocella elongata]
MSSSLRTLSSIAALVAVAAISTPLAQAQGPGGRQQPRFALQALDLNHDGTLSADEIKAAPSSLLTLDRNGDGELTADELTGRPPEADAANDQLVQQLMTFDKAGKGYLVATDLPERMQGMFTRGDANHDGKLTSDEIRTLSNRQAMPAGSSARPGHAQGTFRMDPILNALDLNHNGILEANEIAVATTSLLTLDANHDGNLTSDEIRVRQQTVEDRINHMFDEFDTNKDGKLQRTEVPESLAKDFDAMDSNHDGVLDKAEVLQYMTTHTPARREGPGGNEGEHRPDGPPPQQI